MTLYNIISSLDYGISKYGRGDMPYYKYTRLKRIIDMVQLADTMQAMERDLCRESGIADEPT